MEESTHGGKNNALRYLHKQFAIEQHALEHEPESLERLKHTTERTRDVLPDGNPLSNLRQMIKPRHPFLHHK